MVLILLVLLKLTLVDSFASWFVKDFCYRKLVKGTVIMNSLTLESDERWLRVFKDNVELKSGYELSGGESLEVRISNAQDQYVFESNVNGFIDGGCDGKRTDRDGSIFKVPDTPSSQVLIWAGEFCYIVLGLPYLSL